MCFLRALIWIIFDQCWFNYGLQFLTLLSIGYWFKQLTRMQCRASTEGKRIGSANEMRTNRRFVVRTRRILCSFCLLKMTKKCRVYMIRVYKYTRISWCSYEWKPCTESGNNKSFKQKENYHFAYGKHNAVFSMQHEWITMNYRYTHTHTNKHARASKSGEETSYYSKFRSLCSLFLYGSIFPQPIIINIVIVCVFCSVFKQNPIRVCVCPHSSHTLVGFHVSTHFICITIPSESIFFIAFWKSKFLQVFRTRAAVFAFAFKHKHFLTFTRYHSRKHFA